MLTKIVGHKKKFGSKNFRQSERVKQTNEMEQRRSIQIMPLRDISKKVKTMIQKTFRKTSRNSVVNTDNEKLSPHRQQTSDTSVIKKQPLPNNVIKKAQEDPS